MLDTFMYVHDNGVQLDLTLDQANFLVALDLIYPDGIDGAQSQPRVSYTTNPLYGGVGADAFAVTIDHVLIALRARNEALALDEL